MRNVTLAEIAQRAGVHLSTVSRSLSANPSGVSEPTVKRIQAIANEMGYQPDPAAGMLRTGRSRVIGAVVPRLTDYVLARIYEGIDESARLNDYQTFITGTNDDVNLRLSRIDSLMARRVEGVIVGDARLDGDELVGYLKRRGIPYVLVNRRLRGHLSVTTDDVKGGHLAADHLIELGHTKVGVVAGPEFASTCVERTYGFVQRFLTAGIGVPDSHIVTSRPDAEGGYFAASQLLRDHPDITAIFAINDFAAIGAYGASRENGREIGEDIAIVGFNDVPLTRFMSVPLTSVHSPMFEMGQKAAQLLTEVIASESKEQHESVLLEPELRIRESSTGMRSSPAS